MSEAIGKPMDRVDGRLKVTGGAHYSSDIPIPDSAHAAIVLCTIARGRIRDIDTREALRAPGVLDVLTHKNAPRLNRITFTQPLQPPASKGRGLLPLQSDRILYAGQHIAVVVAERLEQAEYAAALVRITYDEEPPVAEFERGMVERAFKVAAEALGLPMAQVTFDLGDTLLPEAPNQGGSVTMASVGSVVQSAAMKARARVLALGRADRRTPVGNASEEQVGVEQGRFFLRDNPQQGETYAQILKRHGLRQIEERAEWKAPPRPTSTPPGGREAGEGQQRQREEFSKHAFGAHFVEVRVDADTGEVRVSRVATAIGAGRIINPKTARSQITGAVIGGIGMALHEQTHTDRRYGRYVNPNLAEYHVPVNADIPDSDVHFVDEQDRHVNPLGVKGVGEIGIVGVAAAIANAVYHATGKRIRELPITPDLLL